MCLNLKPIPFLSHRKLFIRHLHKLLDTLKYLCLTPVTAVPECPYHSSR